MKDNFMNNDTHMKFVNIINKFKNNYRMDKIVGMKKSEFFMLARIDCANKKGESATVSQISNEMQLTNAAISKTISELEDQGYLVKTVNKDDKRQAHIELTEKGKIKLKEAKYEMDTFSYAVFKKFGKENTDQLYELLEKIYEITTDEISSRIKNSKINE